MKKPLVILFLIILVETVPVSCYIFCPCGSCDSGPAKKIQIVSWQLQTISDQYLGVDPNDTYLYDQVYKALNIDQRNMVINRKSSGGSPFNSAYACSPVPLEAIQTFTSIQLKSTVKAAYSDATDIINVGDDITDKFVMSFFHDMNFKPIPEFINSLVLYDQDKYQFRLKEKPFQETGLVFDMIITMSDGNMYEFKNERLTVN